MTKKWVVYHDDGDGWKYHSSWCSEKEAEEVSNKLDNGSCYAYYTEE